MMKPMNQLFTLFIIMAFAFVPAAVRSQDNIEAKTYIILLGPPASGKGTQAVRLAKEFSLPHISTGDLLREHVANGTELGKKAKSVMEEGKLVSDEIVLGMLFERLAQNDAVKGAVLDGFPRTIAQAEALDRHFQKKDRVVVLNLNVKDDLLIKRTSGRRICPKTGTVYNIYFNPPKVEGKCDISGETLIQRPDDAREVVEKRLAVYKAQTAPLIEYYKKQGHLKDVDGEQSPDAVFQSLKSEVSRVL
jgi:adenylate kinase